MIDCNCSACTGDMDSTSPHWENVLPEINHLEIEREGKKTFWVVFAILLIVLPIVEVLL